MDKYSISCEDGHFKAEFSGNTAGLLANACCVVVGMYRHIKEHDKDRGDLADAFRDMCGNGLLFDEAFLDRLEDAYRKEGGADDVQ